MRTRKTLLVTSSLVLLVGALGWRALDTTQRDGPPQVDMVVDATTREAVIEQVISNLNRAYVFPEVAAQIELGLRRQRGEFDSITSAEALAAQLTKTLRALANGDQHLMVRYSEKPVSVQSNDATPPAEEVAALQVRSMRKNAGFESLRRLRGNIGSLELSMFYRPDQVAPKLSAAMVLLANTSAMVIDLRDCGGGDPETVMLVASAFFDVRTHLTDIFWRDEGRTEERWTDPDAPARYGQTRPLVIVVGPETASGCEDFAYALQQAKRATVIGETTAGAAHAGAPKRLTEHFMLFVPSGRPLNSVTHANWEGVGVTPDVRVSVDKALVAAHVELLERLIAIETDDAWKAGLVRTVADLD